NGASFPVCPSNINQQEVMTSAWVGFYTIQLGLELASLDDSALCFRRRKCLPPWFLWRSSHSLENRSFSEAPYCYTWLVAHTWKSSARGADGAHNQACQACAGPATGRLPLV